jgi:phospholipase/lecithinase/hemolysin
MKRIKTTKLALASLCLASLAALSGCGGGAAGDTTPSKKISSVRVFGDSLADSGTFGFKATVQTTGNYLFVERVALAYGQTLCNYYAATGTDTFVPNPTAGCTNYAIAGGRVNSAALANPTTNQKGITLQLAAGGATAYGATEMAVVDGGGNDAADLVGAFLAAQQGSTASLFGLFQSALTPAQLGAINPANPATLVTAGGQYMTALADNLYASITANVLSKGGNYVLIANIPDITLTPRFQMVLASIGASQGAATQQQLQAVFQGWISAFNAEIAAKASGDSRVVVVDIYSNFQDEVAHPAQYALTNVTTPACPVTGVGSDGLPVYDFTKCTAAAAASGWQSYLFSDGFHPTPYGHQLAAQLVSRSLAQKGWL